MADNYLERQYASYEARKAAWEREKRLGKKRAHRVHTSPAEDGSSAPASCDAGDELPIRNDDNLVTND